MIPSLRVSDQHRAVSGYMRNDKLFRSKNILGKNLRKLLEGMAVEIGRAEGLIDDISQEYDIERTTELIEEWESALGIPDDCFLGIGSIEDRRRDVLVKLTSLGVSIESEFIALAERFGLTVEISSGIEEVTFPLQFPLSFNGLKPRWIMYVKIINGVDTGVFTYQFPFVLGSGEAVRILICLFQKLVPSVVKVFFKIV